MSTSHRLDEEGESLLKNVETPLQHPKDNQMLLHLLLSTSIFVNIIFIVTAIVHSTGGTHVSKPSYENGFTSDLDLIRSRITLVEKTFSGGVELDSEGHFVTDQGGREFVGLPSPELDQAWDQLLEGLNIDLGVDEVDLSGSTFQWPESGNFFTGLDVFHSLHCLNRLRQALYPDYYDDVFTGKHNPSRHDHIDHCINHIRQAIQCNADLTPMEWKLEGSQIILKTNTSHTCRDFDKIHAWASSHRTKFDSIESWKNWSLVIVD